MGTPFASSFAAGMRPMTEPTEQRIEAAARAIWEITHPNPPGWSAWGDRHGFGPSDAERALTLRQARAALTADAPALAAEYERGREDGLREALEIAFQYGFTAPVVRDIDARLSAKGEAKGSIPFGSTQIPSKFRHD